MYVHPELLFIDDRIVISTEQSVQPALAWDVWKKRSTRKKLSILYSAIASVISIDLWVSYLFIWWLRIINKKLKLSKDDNEKLGEITSLTDEAIYVKKKEWKKIQKGQSASSTTYREFSKRCTRELSARILLLLGLTERNQYWSTKVLFYLDATVRLFSFILCHILLIGQLFTQLGRDVWYIIGKKFLVFISVSMGIWTEKCYSSYKFDSDIIGERADDQVKNVYSQTTSAIIAPRALLLLIFPQFTLFALYAIATSGTPMIITSNTFREKIGPLFSENAYEVQRMREQRDSGSPLSAHQRSALWTLYFASYSVYWRESRAINYIQNLFGFAMSIGIVFYPIFWIVCSFFVYFPRILTNYFSFIVLIGKVFHLRDEDFSILGVYFSPFDCYDGEFTDDVKDARGKFTYPNKDCYEGEIIDGKRNGLGKMTYSSGDIYEGEFKDDLKHGKGKFIFSNGSSYEGEYTSDERNGFGQVSYADGTSYKGEWKNDAPIGILDTRNPMWGLTEQSEDRSAMNSIETSAEQRSDGIQVEINNPIRDF